MGFNFEVKVDCQFYFRGEITVILNVGWPRCLLDHLRSDWDLDFVVGLHGISQTILDIANHHYFHIVPLF
jgi:hypothetical protein